MKITSDFSREDYGENYQVHILNQYQLYVEMADRISSRRQAANSFYLSINTALITVLTFLKTNTDANKVFLALITAISGFILCFAWSRLIKSYKNINAAKFKVIHEIEKRLPLTLYLAEWRDVEEGENPKLYRPLTNVESYIPCMFLSLYILVTIAFLIW